VQLWLNDQEGQKVSTDMMNGALVLVPGDAEQVGSVDLQAPVETPELEVWVAYEDDDGTHRKRLDVQLS
jgi:hypothetical protein